MKIRLLIGALLAPSLAVAQAPAAPSPVIQLEPVVITATRTPQPADEVLAAVTVIGRDEIERSQALDIAELLRFHAGLEIARNGGPGQVSSVFIRGGESNHTLVLVDGQRINPATAGGAALQNLSPEMIERIEVLRGPRSTLYGSDAIAGVINIITRAPTAPAAAVTARAGSDNTRDVSALLAYGNGVSGVSVDAAHAQTDGIPSCSSTKLDRGYRRDSLNLRGVTRLGAVGVSARLWDAEGNTEYLDFCGNNQPLDQDFRNQVAAVDFDMTLARGWNSQLSLARMQDDIQQNQENLYFPGEYDRVRTTRPSVDWHNAMELGPAQRLSFGANAAREHVEALSFGIAIEEDSDILGGFVQDEVTVGRHHGTAALSYTDQDAFGDRINWNLEYGLDLFAATRLSIAAGTGFRAPDASDRFGLGGNPDLKPEQSRSYELGLRQLLAANQTLDLRLFRNDVDDLISVLFDPANDPNQDFGLRAVNIGEYRNTGAELSYRYALQVWTLQLAGITQDPEDRSTGSQLLRRAKRSLTASLARKIGATELGVDLLASAKRPDVDAETGAPVTDGGYTLANLTAAWTIDRHFKLQGRVENLLDKDYVTAAGYGQPGRSMFVTLGYAY